MSGLPDLITLNLSNNAIGTIHQNSKKRDEASADNSEVKWRSLVFLDLSFNKITEIEDLKFPKLKELNLANNDIRRVESVESAEQLEVMNLANNQVADGSKIKGLRNLHTLNLVLLSE